MNCLFIVLLLFAALLFLVQKKKSSNPKSNYLLSEYQITALTSLKFVRIAINMDVPPTSLKLDDVLDIYITWERKPLEKGDNSYKARTHY